DTLGGIAALYGVSVEDLAAVNGINDQSYIYVGQELQIPGGGIVTAASVDAGHGEVAPSGGSSGGGTTYTVKTGATPYAYASKYGSSVDAIAQANGLSDPNSLSVGQVLTIP